MRPASKAAALGTLPTWADRTDRRPSAVHPGDADVSRSGRPRSMLRCVAWASPTFGCAVGGHVLGQGKLRRCTRVGDDSRDTDQGIDQVIPISTSALVVWPLPQGQVVQDARPQGPLRRPRCR